MNNKIVMRTRRVARRQRGLFTLERALDCGWPATTVRRRVHDGILEEPAPRVYRFAGVPLAWEDTLLPLLLSADAAAARRSAAALFKLLPSPKEPHVIVPRGRRNLDRVVVLVIRPPELGRHSGRRHPGDDADTNNHRCRGRALPTRH